MISYLTNLSVDFFHVLDCINNTFFCSTGMTFNVSLGFSGLKNEKAKEEVDKVYALFVGETVIANEVCDIVNKVHGYC